MNNQTTDRDSLYFGYVIFSEEQVRRSYGHSTGVVSCLLMLEEQGLKDGQLYEAQRTRPPVDIEGRQVIPIVILVDGKPVQLDSSFFLSARTKQPFAPTN
jgi:hypothetical protein